MKLTSSSFEHGKSIPSKYTCDGENISPPLQISEVPKNAKSFALIMDDPDAPMGTWVHWVVWNIDTKTTELKESGKLIAKEGITDFKRPGYGGPCPPSGTHRYFFKLYALDTKLNIIDTATKIDLEKAMQGHILEKAELMGTYSKR